MHARKLTQASAALLREAYAVGFVPYWDRGRAVGVKVYVDANHGSGYLCDETGRIVFRDDDEALAFVRLHGADPRMYWGTGGLV